MQYFVPDIRLPEDLTEATGRRDKFGGRPWGLPGNLWPKCRDCGGTQSFLAQFQHDLPRLDLGREGRILFVFQCNRDPGMCATWEGGSGANACFIVEADDQLDGISELPVDSPLVENEVHVAGWLARDDGLPTELEKSFFSDEEYFALDESLIEAVPTCTRLGGLPSWIQSPCEAPSASGGWRFVGQLDSTHSFLSSPSVQQPWVSSDSERGYYGEGPNFGDGGIAYLFLRPRQTLPEGWFFWQCG